MALEDVILSRLKKLEEYLSILKGLSKREEEEIINDPLLLGSAERYLQTSIECVIDIGNHIVSAEKLGKVENYAEIFRILEKNKLIHSKLEKNLVNMVRFRNRLVHSYFSIDPKIIYKIIQEDLEDFQEFIKSIVRFLKAKKEKK
ncbi:MAG: type VII toxin-antitoxin system HepT family RNase toxin [Candidatus Hodarchaeales archaeon]